MSRTAHNVFLIIVGIIIAQLWGVVRRLTVCAFKTHEKRSVFLSLSLLSSFWPSLFSSFTYLLGKYPKLTFFRNKWRKFEFKYMYTRLLDKTKHLTVQYIRKD
ncbi:hypothetical protein XU18_5081 [Perkinsela sp. CCAP 1560/4]|nr:hypothetical protein XU18_5081 [Perkinsela sp. CCAP 1560/4]|eukprot:KNH02028.1 hypothetical protein XU18_5081 [Perkinsela sp. CCAP 1560/4]